MGEFEDLDLMIEDIKGKVPRPITYVCMILDRSGSMDVMKEEAIDAFNKEIETIRESRKGNQVYLSLVTFSTEVDSPMYWNTNVNDADLNELLLNTENYVPDGLTALMDAIGTSIDRLDKEIKVGEKDDISFLIIIVSDGQENNSEIWSRGGKLKEKIQELTGRGMWTFTYLGTNQDVVETAKHYGISLGNVMYYDNTAKGYTSGGQSTSIGTESYFMSRTSGERMSDDFYSSQGDEQENENGS